MLRLTRARLSFVTFAAASLLLAGCQTAPLSALPATTSASSLASAPVLRQDVFRGIYEVTVSQDGATVFVADTTRFDGQNAGFVHRLDARTLQVLQTTQTPRRAFALGLNHTTNTLYVGNTFEGSLSVVDASSGIVRGVIQLAEAEVSEDGKTSYPHSRKVIVDEQHNRVFVTSPGQPGMIWIVDGNTNTLTHTIVSEGIWTAGAAYNPQNNRLYVSQGGVNEVLEIDPDAGKVVRAFTTGDSAGNTGDDSKHFFINSAIDVKGQRLFSTDGNSGQLYVLDIASGKFVKQVPITGEGLLDVIFNPLRNEIVISHRGVSRKTPTGTGGVTVLDATSFEVKQTFDLPVHPNSLAVSPDGQTLYVTIKAPAREGHPAFRKDGQESLVRIDLR